VWASARNIVAKTGRTFEDAVQTLARFNAGGRLVQPHEVAAAAVALLAADARNGETIVIDGRAEAPAAATAQEGAAP
jgi:hypothetical protein